MADGKFGYGFCHAFYDMHIRTKRDQTLKPTDELVCPASWRNLITRDGDLEAR